MLVGVLSNSADILHLPLWQLGLICLLAFYLAVNLGANDVANSMGTSVGSKAISLGQAIIIAGILEFSGAVFFGQKVAQTLATGVVNIEKFSGQPLIFLLGMVSVLVAAGLWLQIATSRGWPVSSSHAVVGSIAGFSTIALGVNAVNWSNIGLISAAWLVTPVISGSIAALFYTALKKGVLTAKKPVDRFRVAIPLLSTALFSIFGVIVLEPLLNTNLINSFLENQLGIKVPIYVVLIAIVVIAAMGLTLLSWQQLERKIIADVAINDNLNSSLDVDEEALINNQLKQVEWKLGHFQIISACFVAFAHGSNDVGNAVAPLAAIVSVQQTGTVPLNGFNVPLWILVLGGAGIVTGLAIWGKKVIATIGEGIIPLQPSAGFCAELATATTVLLASRLGLPVSTSHALVGGVVGIGLVQWLTTTVKSENPLIAYKTVLSIAFAWLVTIPVAAILSAGGFSITHLFFN